MAEFVTRRREAERQRERQRQKQRKKKNKDRELSGAAGAYLQQRKVKWRSWPMWVGARWVTWAVGAVVKFLLFACTRARARKGVELCCHALGGLGLFERTNNTWEVPQVPQVQVGTRYLDKIRWLKKEKEEKKKEKRAKESRTCPLHVFVPGWWSVQSARQVRTRYRYCRVVDCTKRFLGGTGTGSLR